MRKSHSLIAAAVIAAGAFAFTPTTWAQQTDDRTTGQKVGDSINSAADKTGDAAKKAVDKTEQAVGLEASDNPETNAKHIRAVVAEVTEAALTKNGLDDLEERLCKNDRERLDQNKDALKNNAALDGRIEQFQKDWKAKYNQDFKIPDKNAVYSADFAMITQGAEARTASSQIPADAAKPAPDADKQDRDFAVLKISASHDQPALSVPLVYEKARGWKIEIPDSVDANKLRDNVQAALTKCDDMKDKWPSDVNEAYRAVSHSVLAAIMDQKGGEAAAQPAAGQLPADQGTAPPPATPSR